MFWVCEIKTLAAHLFFEKVAEFLIMHRWSSESLPTYPRQKLSNQCFKSVKNLHSQLSAHTQMECYLQPLLSWNLHCAFFLCSQRLIEFSNFMTLCVATTHFWTEYPPRKQRPHKNTTTLPHQNRWLADAQKRKRAPNNQQDHASTNWNSPNAARVSHRNCCISCRFCGTSAFSLVPVYLVQTTI